MTITWEKLIEETKSDPQFSDPYILFNGNNPSAFALLWELNPGIPNEILVGDDIIVINKAEKYLSNPLPIPLYMKIGTNNWELKGIYGNPIRIDDRDLFKDNEKIRLAMNPKSRVSFAIRLSKIK